MPANYSKEQPAISLRDAAHQAATWIARIPGALRTQIEAEIGEPPLEQLWAALAAHEKGDGA